MPTQEGPWGALLSYNTNLPDTLRSHNVIREATLGTPVPFIAKVPLKRDSLLDAKEWRPLSVSIFLGLPLIFQKSASLFVPTGTSQQYNMLLAYLSLYIDPSSSEFGKSIANCKDRDAIVSHANDHDLEPEHAWIMMEFVQSELQELITYGKMGTRKDLVAKKKAEAALAQATPKAFESFCKGYRSMKQDKVKPLFEECMPLCKGCGMSEETSGAFNDLYICVDCGSVSYWSQACQKADHKLHESVYHPHSS